MRSLLVFAALAALCGWVGIRFLPTTEAIAARPSAVRAQEIQSVAIDGGRGLPLAALRAKLSTRPGLMIDAAALAQDRSAIESELMARGRLAAKVEPATVTFAREGGAFVTFTVTQGPMFKLRSVRVEGATDTDTGVVTLTAGDEASADRIERARQALGENLARRGKPGAVAVTVTPDLAAGVVDVVFAVAR